MVTISLLAIGLVGVSSMFIVGYRTQLHAHYASVGGDTAAKKIERMRAAGFNGVNATNFPPSFAVTELPNGQGAISIQPYPETSSTNQALVTVTVSWAGGRGVEGRVQLQSVMSNHG
jgi:hypothetical protein